MQIQKEVKRRQDEDSAIEMSSQATSETNSDSDTNEARRKNKTRNEGSYSSQDEEENTNTFRTNDFASQTTYKNDTFRLNRNKSFSRTNRTRETSTNRETQQRWSDTKAYDHKLRNRVHADKVVVDSGSQTPRMYTQAEMDDSVKKGEILVAIRKKVYDLTTFAKRHPGGINRLLAGAGKDVTPIFETNHPESAYKALEKFHKGYLVDSSFPTFNEPSEFSIVLKKRVADYFKKNNLDEKYSHWMVVRYAVIAAAIIGGFFPLYWSDTIRNSFVLTSALCILWGFAHTAFCMYWIHDGSHGSFTHNPRVWDFMSLTYDFVVGGSHVNWFYQHVMGHHPYTNIEGADPDISTSPDDIRRIKPSQPWHQRYLYQYLYCPVIYCLLSYKVRLLDYKHVYLLKAQENVKINPLTGFQHFIFWSGKTVHFIVRYIIPYVYSESSGMRVLMTNLAVEFVLSWTLALVFQANHVVEEVAWPKPDKFGVVPGDWTVLQVETAQDYSHGSYWAAMLSGGLNYQVIHHIFPQISQYYYHDLAPIVRDTCAEFGVSYKIRDTFWSALGGHLGLLKYLGSGEAAFGHLGDCINAD